MEESEKVKLINSILKTSMSYWKKQKEENDIESMQKFYNGAVASLDALYEKIQKILN